MFKSAVIIIMFLIYNQLSRNIISVFNVYDHPIAIPGVDGGSPVYYLQSDFAVQVREHCVAAAYAVQCNFCASTLRVRWACRH